MLQAFEVFFFTHGVCKGKVWSEEFPMDPTEGVMPRQADVGVTLRGNECNI